MRGYGDANGSAPGVRTRVVLVGSGRARGNARKLEKLKMAGVRFRAEGLKEE